ncbi:MAG: hypothetical protein ACK4YV_06850 [Emticicia sp.]
MKKLLLILTLFLSVSGSLFAQTINHEQQWNQAIEIQLKNNAKAYVVSNVTPLLLEAAKYNLDSLIKVALAKYKEIEEETDELASKSVTYHYGLNDKNWKYSLRNPKEGLTVKIHQANEKRYGIIGGNEFVKLKTMKDTLVVNLIFGELPDEYKGKANIKNTPKIGYQLSYGFIINNLSDLESIDYKQVIVEIKKNINKIKAKIGIDAMMKKPTMSINTLTIAETSNAQLYWNYQGTQIFTLTAHTSGGWIRDKFIPEVGIDALIITKGRIGFGLGANQFFHFNNLSDNTFKLSTSNFVNAQISFFSSDPRKKYYGLAKFANVGNISLGYLVNKSTYFSKHTWRLSTTLPIMKHLSVEPEFYFSPSTKQLYPGVRFKIM